MKSENTEYGIVVERMQWNRLVPSKLRKFRLYLTNRNERTGSVHILKDYLNSPSSEVHLFQAIHRCICRQKAQGRKVGEKVRASEDVKISFEINIIKYYRYNETKREATWLERKWVGLSASNFGASKISRLLRSSGLLGCFQEIKK